ncbi:asparagine synthase (glutamine-hydrolyzing) [Xanthomonas vasicola]|uniref:asparagine synthase (glutamine-hydrolyzing) n=1 Tax=Xanthomonas vasicola TaxID=56459 RepID=UPI0001CBF6DA|nr:asparagine synthase (glutamine-hydrolyzing) [Xanthomonas vasicola]KFA39583.1 asparagine synthetase [Xanthomonas vasicola pv. musacearum NCPPB 4384]AZR29739.1 asparagine synthase (glutamine-hydrolyzing) [Xanthomonas vasicola pv. musacearum NCPPB 4379]KFA09169.1 asparagine synthetase [Xanthomonas vasicola pv. musacearum NCPPB 2005]KFA14880.1 asparagine synthetase [Xanthomonas vasicola pv. musacearum NCPPB 4380]KFA18173.1 asparagine synthetase [Xanthomonas vasicola pv. musacearum NCPPB 4392]
MCGFVGIFHRDGARFEQRDMLHAMNQTIVHRGPDDAGIHLSGPLGLGFRRLSVIDVPGGHQPMIDAHTGVALVFNGEIYNYKQLREQLEALGAQFCTRSDTEVLLRSFIHWGAQCVERLSGMFAFAAWDPRTGTLTLARDRLGVKPLYWTQIGADFVFASEVKAFFAHHGFERRADLDGISSYLSFRHPVWDNTYFEGVHKLLPGEMLVVTPARVHRQRYWALPTPMPEQGRTESDWLEALSEKLDAAVRRCLVSDVPLGAYLSGGLDSNIMVALMARHMASPPQTFSVGYDTHGYDEGAYAAEAAAAVGAEHTHLVIDRKEYIDGMAPLIVQCDAPLMIPQMVAGLKLSKEIRRHVKVALSGDGADELFGGYGRVMRSPFDWKKIAAARRLLGPAAQWVSKLGKDPYGPVSNLGCARQIEHFFNVYHWMPLDEKMALLSPDVRSRLNGDQKTLAPFEEAFAQTRDCDPHDRVLHVFQKIHLGCVLDKVDTIGMLASLEGRVPFVDHELVETFIHMPHRLKMKWRSPLALIRALGTSAFNASEVLDQSKYLLRTGAQRLLPPHLAQRKKMGFPTPLDDWLKAGMLDDAKAILLDKRSRERGLFDARRLEHFLSHPQSLDYDFYGKKVWMLMNVELWFRGVVDGAPAANAASPPHAVPVTAEMGASSAHAQMH